MKKCLTFPLFAVLVMLASCGKNNSAFSEEKARLDSLLTEVKAAEQIFNQIDVSKNMDVSRSVKGSLKKFQNDFKADISLDEATQFSQFKDIASGLKNFDSKAKHISGELKRTQSQLSDLIQAIDQNADVDRLGQKMDKEYIEKAIDKESEMAESLIDGIHDLKKRSETALARYATEAPIYLNLMDSLVNVNK